MQWRFRTNWRGTLVLQRGNRVPDLRGLPGSTYISWRDAKATDLLDYYKATKHD